MRKILAVIGRPGSGKTSLFREFLKDKIWEDQQLVKLIPSMYNKELNLHLLGKYEEGKLFAGTDVMSMAAMPAAVEFVNTIDSNIIFEGDRLTSGKFFSYLANLPNTEFKLFVITADEEVLTSRYKERGSEQSDQFLSGRKTKLGNIQSNMELMFILDEFKNNNFEDQKIILGKIKEFIG